METRSTISPDMTWPSLAPRGGWDTEIPRARIKKWRKLHTNCPFLNFRGWHSNMIFLRFSIEGWKVTFCRGRGMLRDVTLFFEPWICLIQNTGWGLKSNKSKVGPNFSRPKNMCCAALLKRFIMKWKKSLHFAFGGYLLMLRPVKVHYA